MPNIDTLILDIQKLFNNGCTLSAASLEYFTKTVESGLRDRFEEYKHERHSYLRMSNVGKPLRQLWFEISSGLKPEPLPASAKFKFLYGDILEDILLLLAIEAGHTVTDIGREVEVDGVKGKIDCIIDGWLIDFKSCSQYSFNKFKDGTLRDKDSFGYIGQLSGYSHALGGIDAAYLAINKVLGHLCLLKLTKEERDNYDIRTRIRDAREVLKSESPPTQLCYEPIPEGKSGNYKLPVECSYCDYKHHCHEGLRTFLYSFGPVYMTNVASLPRVQELKREG